MTTRRLINETALTYTKLLMLMQERTDEEIDELLSKDDVERVHTLAAFILAEGQAKVAERKFSWMPGQIQAEDRMHRITRKPDEN